MGETKKPEQLFSVFAEVDGDDKPLILTGLPFGRLVDEIVVPYEANEPFIIDGAFVKKPKIKRLKIIRQGEFFERTFDDLHWTLRHHSDRHLQELYADQYHLRLEALLRESGDDVTSQVINAYDKTIKPRLKDYLPKREELISAAMKLFLESMKALGGS